MRDGRIVGNIHSGGIWCSGYRNDELCGAHTHRDIDDHVNDAHSMGGHS